MIHYFLNSKKYALQDSIALFKALKVAQNIYLKDYNVNITSILSTSSLSLKIFRLNFLKYNIYNLYLTLKTNFFLLEKVILKDTLIVIKLI
jgi:hypothetical protein